MRSLRIASWATRSSRLDRSAAIAIVATPIPIAAGRVPSKTRRAGGDKRASGMGGRVAGLEAQIAVFEYLVGKVRADAVDAGIHVSSGRHRRDIGEPFGTEFIKRRRADPLGDRTIGREPGADAP